MLACGTHFFFDHVVSIEPKDDMCRLQRPKVLSELAMCVNVPKIALMIHPGSTLSEFMDTCSRIRVSGYVFQDTYVFISTQNAVRVK